MSKGQIIFALCTIGCVILVCWGVAWSAVNLDFGDPRECLQSHIEVTPESQEWGLIAGGVGLGGGFGVGMAPAGGGLKYGWIYKPERSVEVCDVWATEVPEDEYGD